MPGSAGGARIGVTFGGRGDDRGGVLPAPEGARIVMYGWDMSGWGWGWMTLWTVVGLALLGLLVLALLRSSASVGTRDTEDSALALLRRRFAAGEIDDDEYRRRRSALDRTRLS